MELLATVDYILTNEGIDKNNLPEVMTTIHQWTDRKQELVTAEFEVAHARLMQFGSQRYS